MHFDLVLSYPWWYTLLCILLGAAYAFFFYFRTRFIDKKWKIIFLSLRFITVFLLAFLLLSPLLKSSKTIEEKPIVVFVQDNTQSMINHKDSSFMKASYLVERDMLLKNLESKYDVNILQLGRTIDRKRETTFTEKETNLSVAIPFLNNAYEGQNIGAVIFASDGIATMGNSVLSQNLNSRSVLYTIGCGDTTLYKDQILTAVKYNEIAFLGDEFPLRVEINSHFLKNKKFTLRVKENNKTIFSKDLTYQSDDDYLEELLYLPANSTGKKKYKIEVSSINGERSILNNSKYAFIEILDSRKKVHLLYEGPHPDISALKNAISTNKNFQFKASHVSKLPSWNKVDLIILHNLSNGSRTTQILNEIEKNKTSVWFFIGNGGTYNGLNSLKYGCKIQGSNSSNYQAKLNQNFTAFHLPNTFSEIISDWPPINGLYGRFSVAPNAKTVLNQIIGNIGSSNPLMTLTKTKNGNYGVFIGTGIFKWRMAEYAKNKNFDNFDNWVNKSIQYLATYKDKRRFKVTMEKQILREDEPIKFNAILLNSNFETTTNQEISIKIKNENGKIYPFHFSKNASSYSLDAGYLPVGNYTYIASTASGINYSSSFVVKPALSEYNTLTANFTLLKELATTNNGKFYEAKDMKNLEEDLLNNKTLKTTIYQDQSFDDLINNKWLMFLLILLLGGEWLLRRREGTY